LKTKLRAGLVAVLGLCLVVYLVERIGFEQVFSAVLAVGWGGFAILCIYALLLFLALGAAWHVLVAGMPLSRIGAFAWGRAVRDSASEILPFSQVGGFVIGARAIILRGIAPPLALASTIVDVTTEMFAQLAYVALGIALLTMHAPRTPFVESLATTAIIGLLLASVAAGAFLFAQRRGLWIAGKLASRWLPKAPLNAEALAVSMAGIYRAPRRVWLSATLHLACWIASAVGTWIALRLIGARADLAAVVAIESLVYAIRSVAFMVPNALGVQEAAYMMLAPLMGVGPELGLAVSLLKRARDIAIGVPTLLIWQFMEGKRAFTPGKFGREPFKS
jgi:glycosyltransferase 2 family protein